MKQDIDIEDLIKWTYNVQRAHQVERDASFVSSPREYGSTWGGFAALLELGIIVDHSNSKMFDNHALADDAQMVHGRVLALPEDAGVLVLMHGIAENRPDWHPEGAGSYELVLDGRGRRKPIYRDPANRTGLIGYQQRFVGTRPEIVEEGRAEYRVWHEALCLLATDMAGVLEEYRPMPPRCKAEPWVRGHVQALGMVLGR